MKPGDPVGKIRFMMPSRNGQKARPVKQRIWTSQVTLSDGRGGRLSASCVIAAEVDPPPGVKPLGHEDRNETEMKSQESHQRGRPI